MITVDVINKFTGKLKRRYLCKNTRALKRLKRKFRYKFWLRLDVDDYDVKEYR